MKDFFIDWLGHASFRIESAGLVSYIDPFHISNAAHDADYIFSTHTHYDHLSLEDMQKIAKPSTQYVVSMDGLDKIKMFTNKILGVLPNKKYDVSGIKIQTIPAYNLNKEFHPKSNNWVGYILQFANGIKFFHTGDSDNIPDYQTLADEKIDILAVPCGGTYTMNSKEAAEAVRIIRPKQVIPMHWGSIVGSRIDALDVKEKLKDFPIEVLIMGQ